MSADVLRRAAALIRERAERATPGPWRALCDGYGDTSGGRDHEDRRDLLWVRSGETNAGDVVTTYGTWTERSEHDVLHIAGMDPTVALVLADWLDTHRRDLESARGYLNACDSPSDTTMAIVLARAYLGDSQ